MLHALQETSRDVCFIHACRDASEHAFKDEVDTICQINQKIKTVFFCKDVLSQSKSLADYRRDSIESSFFKELNCDSDSECYLCGPKAFMESVCNALVEYGIPKSNIYYESFGESTLLGGTQQELAADEDAQECVIELTKSGKSLQWAGFTGSLLDSVTRMVLLLLRAVD